MFLDKLTRFLEASQSAAIDLPPSYQPAFLGKEEECILFSRGCDFEDMESEDDEQYIFSTSDQKYSSRFNRFQTRIIFKRFGNIFDDERIDRIIKMSWNFNKIIINKKTGEFSSYSKQDVKLPPLPEMSGPSIKTIYTG